MLFPGAMPYDEVMRRLECVEEIRVLYEIDGVLTWVTVTHADVARGLRRMANNDQDVMNRPYYAAPRIETEDGRQVAYVKGGAFPS